MNKETNKLIPELRFPEFVNDGGWEEKQLGEICKFKQGIQVDINLQSQTPKNGYSRFLRIENYTQNSKDFRYIPITLSNDKYITTNEIAIVRYGTTAGFIGRGLDGVLANNLFKLLPNNALIDTNYLFHFLRKNKTFQFFQAAMSGGAMPALSFGIVSTLKFNFGSILEQKKIADCLSSLDEVIAANNQKLEALKEHKKGLMQNLFPQEGETVPKYRFPEFVNDGEWEKKSFAQLFKIGNGRDYKHLSQGKIPVYGSGGFMLLVDDYLYEGESVCIGRKGTIDKPMFLTGKFWTLDTLFFTHSFNDCVPKFIYYDFQKIDWRSHNEAGGVPSLSKSNLYKIEVFIPKPDEQQKIASCLSSLDALIAVQADKIEQLKLHKRGLMQGLFPKSSEK